MREELRTYVMAEIGRYKDAECKLILEYIEWRDSPPTKRGDKPHVGRIGRAARGVYDRALKKMHADQTEEYGKGIHTSGGTNPRHAWKGR